MKKKCAVCKKKLNLTAFECRCKKYFCPLHRYPEQHQCIVDYKNLEKQILKQNLPTICSNKIQII